MSNLDDCVVRYNLATGRLEARGLNFSFEVVRPEDLGPRLEAILKVRAIEGTRGFATSGAPSAEFMRHRFMHVKVGGFVRGCPWCDEIAERARQKQFEAMKVEKLRAKSMSEARKNVERRKVKAKAQMEKALRAALGLD